MARTSPRPRTRAAAALVLAAALGLAACSDADDGATTAAADTPSSVAEQPSIAEQVEGRTIIDVRTAEEFAGGHVEGAVNIDVQAPTFEAQVGELPTDGSYLVYCRSGNRSAAAAAKMAALGFTDVVDGGAYDALVAAGLPTA